ncbi:MAG TPA: PAS domain S-box protein [Acidimicrobiia bacterium]|nr:PAS domain S-box protein [Acidimicrobiia bacterium]
MTIARPVIPDAALERATEARLRRILDGMSEGVVESALDGRFVSVNEAFATMLGYGSPQELLECVLDTNSLFANPAVRAELVGRAAAQDEVVRGDVELKARDGESVWVRAQLRVERDGGEAIGMFVIVQDITASRLADAQIREAEERLRFAFDDNPMPLVVIEFTATGGVVAEANAALESLLGYGRGELVGSDVDSLVHRDRIRRDGNAVGPLPDSSVRVSLETHGRHRDGHWVAVAVTAVTIKSATGRWYATAAIEDITDRRAAEEDTRAALRLLEGRAGAESALADLARMTLESADIEAFGHTACGLVARILQVDFCSILLPTADGSLQTVSEWGWDRRLLAIVDNAPVADSQAAATMRLGESVIVDDWLTETRFTRSPLLEAHDVHSGLTVAIRHDDKTLGAVGVQSRAPREFDDRAIRFLESVAQLVGVALEQHRVKRRLLESEHTLQSIVDNAPVAIHVVDSDGRFLLVNRELERIIGMPRDLLIGRKRGDVPRLAAGSPIAVLVDDLGPQQPSTVVEQTTTEADGEHAYLSVNFPLLDADGRAYGVGGISTEVTELVRARAETTTAWLESINRLSKAVEFRDDSTGAHIERMAAYSDLIARMLGLSPERCAQIRAAAPMHDIGKMAIPDHVLLKPGPFTPEERQIMDAHADVGFRLLTGSGSEILELAATIALSHHERFDGSGYPQGLVGTDIPLEGRIVAIADSFDALTSDRVYRAAMPIDTAIGVMQDETGHFDPDMLDLFVREIDLAKLVWASFHLPAAAVRLDALAAASRYTR